MIVACNLSKTFSRKMLMLHHHVSKFYSRTSVFQTLVWNFRAHAIQNPTPSRKTQRSREKTHRPREKTHRVVEKFHYVTENFETKLNIFEQNVLKNQEKN